MWTTGKVVPRAALATPAAKNVVIFFITSIGRGQNPIHGWRAEPGEL